MSKKILGWFLIIIGILIIGYTLYASVNIFTGKEEPPLLFKSSQNINITNSTTENSQLPKEELRKIVENQLNSMIPEDAIIDIMNLISWSILAGILIFGSFSLSSLGIKLIKK